MPYLELWTGQGKCGFVDPFEKTPSQNHVCEEPQGHSGPCKCSCGYNMGFSRIFASYMEKLVEKDIPEKPLLSITIEES